MILEGEEMGLAGSGELEEVFGLSRRFRRHALDDKNVLRIASQMKRRILLVVIPLLGLLLTGCDVIVEAANPGSYDDFSHRPTGELMNNESLPVTGYGSYYSGLSLVKNQGFYGANSGPLSIESISYQQLITMGIQYSVQNKPIPTPRPAPRENEWMEFPIIPEFTKTARKIYERGISRGNNTRAFSKVGDCQNVPSLFLGPFDDPLAYNLGNQNIYLRSAIDWFAGSFSRESLAVRGGLNAASVLSPFWADPELCERDETPLECEYRIHNPSFAIINFETWWEKSAHSYETYLREIIEITIDHDIVPIISTKADNLEGDHSINATIVRLAVEYDIPIWNFWLAVQPLPNHGLHEDEFHLTYAQNFFDDPQRMTAAWPWRNLTALQALDKVWRGVSAANP
ncbi:MAG: hypothetical protein GTO14_02925 [Anaerolineales bacterium]|nr:hypothetical protein [Anaerolineales bacterium]